MSRTLQRRQGFTLVELLVVISIIAIIAGLVVPVLLKGRGEAVKVQCTNNLKNIYGAASIYANKKFHFPVATGGSSEPRAHDSLNLLLKSNQGKDMDPKLFVCPAGEASPAEKTEGQKFLQLDEDTLAYAWVTKKVKNFGGTKPLSSDKYYKGWEDHEGHDGSVQVLGTDGSVKEMETGDLDEDTGLPEGLGR